MRTFFFAILVLVLYSCGEVINEPKNLLEQSKMAEIIAELSINDQLASVTNNYNPDAQTRNTFKKLNTKPQDFVDSYKYYIAKNKMKNIYVDAQEIILNKDPKTQKQLDKKIKEQEDLAKKEQEKIKNTKK